MNPESWVALAVSMLSACFTGIHAYYARVVARNDQKRMKRAELSFELQLSDVDAPPGWVAARITVRNHERVSADVIGVRARKRGQHIICYDDAFEPDPKGLFQIEQPPFRRDIPTGSHAVIRRRIAPAGTRPSPHGIGPRDTIYLQFYTRGVEHIHDLRFEWEWADGERR